MKEPSAREQSSLHQVVRHTGMAGRGPAKGTGWWDLASLEYICTWAGGCCGLKGVAKPTYAPG